MKILFIGYTVDKQSAEILSGSSIAGNKMQLNLLKGLVKNKELELISLTILPLAPFPVEKRIYINKTKLVLFEDFKTIQIPYLNFPIIKQIHQTLSVYYTAKKIVDEDTVVFGYNLFPQVGLSLKWLKKKYKCRTVALLADLPIDDKNRRSNISAMLRSIFDYLTLSSIKSCDKLIVLNSNAAKTYAPDKDFIVIEGGIDLNEYIVISTSINKTKKNIIYSGALTEYSGVRNLINAMKHVTDNNIYLEIYGTGELKSYVESSSKNIPNVFYRGKVNNQRMQQIQRDAFLLVNPRSPSDPIANVTFPSKIFEYMLSGTPILTTKLSGFTEEYLENMFVIESNASLEIANKINEISSLSDLELKFKAEQAREFITRHKNWDSQCLKIEKFIRTWN